MTILETLRELGYSPRDYGTHYRMAAVFRGGTNPSALCVSKKNGAFVDYGTGEKRGTFKELLALSKKDPQAIEAYLQSTKFADLKELNSKIAVEKIYPESILQNLIPHLDFYTQAGISEETLRKFKVGMAQSGKLNKRYVFPIYNPKNQIIGFAGRWYHKNVPYDTVPKWKIIGKKTDFIYPCHVNDIEPNGDVILVESIGCALKLHDCGIRNAFVVFGLSLGRGLLKMILSKNPSRIIVALNNEPENTSPRGVVESEVASAKILKKLHQYFSPEKVICRLPTRKDFGEMTTEEIYDWKKNL